MKLNESGVLFNEEEHSYTLDGKKLIGITGLIHSVLGLGVYPEANEYIKDHIIPRAGSRGTAVHHAIQTYDSFGFKQTKQRVQTRYGCDERCNVYWKEEEWDVENELNSYIFNLENRGFEAIANEYTVTDKSLYASQIDNVWVCKETGGIWLCDTKTNNLELYPLCGYFVPDYFVNGEYALKEYLSWQLSIYAELFELQNPGLKVGGLACNWLRSVDSQFLIIERKPSEYVRELLKTEYVITDRGIVYMPRDLSDFGIDLEDMPAAPSGGDNSIPQKVQDVVEYVFNTMKQYEESKRRLDEAKVSLRMAMEQYDMNKADLGLFTANIAKDSVTKSFDTKRFQKEHPELYKEYIKETPKKGGLTLKIKSND